MLGGRRVVLIGHEKPRHQSDCTISAWANPKAIARRSAELGRFGLPVVTLVDTSRAFPGVEAEERGQAEAIARATRRASLYRSYGGDHRRGRRSGGAVALASAERVLMLEHAVYSVISPEGCASILGTAEKAPDAAEAMRVTARSLPS